MRSTLPITYGLIAALISAPISAEPKPATWNPSTSRPTASNSSAFTSQMPTPMVSTINGSVKSSRMGFTTTFRKLSSNTTTSNVSPESHPIPGTIFVLSMTPRASTSQRTSRLTSGWFIG